MIVRSLHQFVVVVVVVSCACVFCVSRVVNHRVCLLECVCVCCPSVTNVVVRPEVIVFGVFFCIRQVRILRRQANSAQQAAAGHPHDHTIVLTTLCVCCFECPKIPANAVNSIRSQSQ